MKNSIEKEIILKAPVSKVWRALTDYKQFGEWFDWKVDRPFVPGGASGGRISCTGHEQYLELTVQKIEPETYFSYTWHPYAVDPNIDYSKETPTLVEFRLEPKGGGTLLTVKESGFEKIPKQRLEEALRQNTRGWEFKVEDLQKYVERD
jgi:uncharacterized protein YndB with AHSA1/START domain